MYAIYLLLFIFYCISYYNFINNYFTFLLLLSLIVCNTFYSNDICYEIYLMLFDYDCIINYILLISEPTLFSSCLITNNDEFILIISFEYFFYWLIKYYNCNYWFLFIIYCYAFYFYKSVNLLLKSL
jgi:hypothetical protein